MDPEIVPYYLLLIGPPDVIPFDFQYLLGVEYAIGRLAFETAVEYENYARSIVAYDSAKGCSERERDRLLGNASSRRSRDEFKRLAAHRSAGQWHNGSSRRT
jgi:hypothetical protein